MCSLSTGCLFKEVIWRFIDSYRKGLTGEAAVWVVKKQKGHRAVSEKAMKALEKHSKSQNS